jgi:hypothetical protein
LGGGFGRALAVGDLDLDGVADLLVGSGETIQNTAGTLYWYSLRDGSLVTNILPPGLPSYPTLFANTVTIGAPQPGHPFPVFVCPDAGYGLPTAVGRLTMFRAAPDGVKGLGPGCTGTLSAAPQLGFTDLGENGIRIHLSNAPPAATARVHDGDDGHQRRLHPLQLPRAAVEWVGDHLERPMAGGGDRRRRTGCAVGRLVLAALTSRTAATTSSGRTWSMYRLVVATFACPSWRWTTFSGANSCRSGT